MMQMFNNVGIRAEDSAMETHITSQSRVGIRAEDSAK